MGPRTVPTLVRASAARFPDISAVIDGPTTLTFSELAAEVDRVARSLIASGVQRGDRVAIWMPNSVHTILVTLGIQSMGAVVVPINTRYRGDEMREVLDRTDACAIFVQDHFLDFTYVSAVLGTTAPGSNVRFIVDVSQTAPPREKGGDPPTVSWQAFVALADSVSPQESGRAADAVRPEDLSDIIFTSGTTGRSKGVQLVHGASIALYESYGSIWGLRAGDRYLLSLPMFHAGGAKAGILVCLVHGVTAVPMAVFDTDRMFDMIERHRISVLNGPPTVWYSLLDHPERRVRNIGSLRLGATGAAVVPVRMVERVLDELALEHFITAYGMTECCGTASMCRVGDSREVIATTNGRALPGTELRVVDARGRTLAACETGEILVRGPHVTPGYWDTPELTAEAVRNGWLHTGDVGHLDEHGNLAITDRLKDMFTVGGFNVAPAEIEQVLARHPDVREVSVIGIPDSRLGEVARAYVVARSETPDETEMIAWCREKIANFKVPRSIVFVPEFPRTPSGKVLKGQLRAAATEDKS